LQPDLGIGVEDLRLRTAQTLRVRGAGARAARQPTLQLIPEDCHNKTILFLLDLLINDFEQRVKDMILMDEIISKPEKHKFNPQNDDHFNCRSKQAKLD
jgi:hypothetical protein